MYRPSISFEGAKVHEGTKSILRTDTHSDVIIVVKYVCSTP